MSLEMVKLEISKNRFKQYIMKDYVGKDCYSDMSNHFWEMYCVDEPMNTFWSAWLAWCEQEKNFSHLLNIDVDISDLQNTNDNNLLLTHIKLLRNVKESQFTELMKLEKIITTLKPLVDMVKSKFTHSAYLNSLDKGVVVLNNEGHRGDADTILEIKNFLGKVKNEP